MANGTSPLTAEGYQAAFNRNLLPMSRNIFNNAESEHRLIARVESTNRQTNEFQTIQGLQMPRRARDNEPIPQDAPVTGYKSVISILGFRCQVTVEKSMIETEVFDAPIDNAQDMMLATVALKDLSTANLYNQGFTDSLAQNIVEFDGTARAFFSTGHYYENGSGTFSNYYNVGVPPTPEVVYLVVNQYLRRLKDFANTRFVNYGKRFIIVTPTLNPAYGMAADEIVQSVDRPDTANRATNVLKSVQLSHVSLNWLTSSTKWFIIVPPDTLSFPVRLLNQVDYEVDPLGPMGKLNPRAYVTSCTTRFGTGFDKQYRGCVAIGA